MNLLFVLPEGIQIEEGPWAGRTGQSYTLMGPAHMVTGMVDGPSLHPSTWHS